MKSLSLLASIISILTLTCQPTYSQWIVQNSGVTATLNDVCFVDEFNGWVVGDNSAILHTTNGGDTWQTQAITGENYDFRKIEMLSLYKGYLISDSGLLWGFTAESSWEALSIPNNNRVYDFSFISDDVGWIVASDSCCQYILYTRDGGKTWEELLSNYAPNPAAYEIIKTVKFINQEIGFYLSGSTMDSWDDTNFFKSTDGGKSWNLVGISSFSEWIISVGDINNIWLGESVLEITNDGGVNWFRYESNNFRLLDLELISSNNGFVLHYILEYGANLYYTEDCGITWNDLKIPGGYILRAFDTYNYNSIWVVGKEGTIIKYMGIINHVEQNEQTGENNIIEFSSYPNPFNSQVKICFRINKHDNVSLSIYNVNGELITTLLNKVLEKGYYGISWDATNNLGRRVPTGMYLYTLYYSNSVYVSKSVLLR